MGRLLLDPIGTEPVDGVVRRLGAVQAQDDAAAEFAIRTRRLASPAGEVAAALAEGSIVKTFAFRGATHLMTPEKGGKYLALRAASCMWERPSWRSHYGLEPSHWPRLREVVREALAHGPLTRGEIGSAVTRETQFAHLGFAFEDDSINLLKALAWHGDLCFGPPRGRIATFQRLDQNPRWGGVPDLDEAGGGKGKLPAHSASRALAAAFGRMSPDQTDGSAPSGPDPELARQRRRLARRGPAGADG